MGDGRRRGWAAGGVGVPTPERAEAAWLHPRVARAPWLAVGAVCVGAFMGQLDASIVTLALPSLQRSFDASLGAVTWVALSYLLVLVALVTAFGRVSDMAGRKLIYLYGFVVFTIGSALCGLARRSSPLTGPG